MPYLWYISQVEGLIGIHVFATQLLGRQLNSHSFVKIASAILCSVYFQSLMTSRFHDVIIFSTQRQDRVVLCSYYIALINKSSAASVARDDSQRVFAFS